MSPQLFDSSSTIPLWLDGEQITTGNSFDVVSPTTGEYLYKSAAASVEDATRAVESAQTAFKTWSKTKLEQRRDIFLRAAEILQRRKDEFSKLTYKETGEIDMMFGFEFNLAVEACKSVAGLIYSMQGSVPSCVEEGRSAMVLHEPYGVVLSIAPWNAPYILGFRACLGPLAMGNTVVFKSSEWSPGSHWNIASVFHEAGLPKGCLNTIAHRPQDAVAVTTALIESAAVRKINFTGSVRVGAIIASQAARLLKPSVMELGGKASTIVCSDADIEQAAIGAAMGTFMHSGQVCMCTERIILHTGVVERFKPAFKQAIDQIFAAPNGFVLVNENAAQKNKDLVQDAVSKGANIVYDDANPDTVKLKTSMKPVVVENVKEGMDIYHTESFGPTVSLFVVNSDEEAIAIANDTDCGLTSSIYTEDLRKALRFAKEIQSGAVHINSMSIHDESTVPHGGWKNSGYGRFNGLEGLREWVQTKSITWKN